jgi:hypothetical protein
MRRMKTKIPMQIYLRDTTVRCGDGEREPFRLPLNRGRSVFFRRRNPSLIIQKHGMVRRELIKVSGLDFVTQSWQREAFLAFYWPGILISTTHLKSSLNFDDSSKGEIFVRHLRAILSGKTFSQDKRYPIPPNNQRRLCPTPYM